MPIQTIAEPSSDAVQKMVYNKAMRRSNRIVMPADQKLAVVILALASAVTQADYPALKTAIETVSGIQQVNLLIDGKTPASIPEDTELRVCVDAQIRIDDLPQEEA